MVCYTLLYKINYSGFLDLGVVVCLLKWIVFEKRSLGGRNGFVKGLYVEKKKFC